MNTNIFAWTEPTPDGGFPAYISINRDESGKHTITLRARGNAGRDVVTVEVTPQLLESMLGDVAADLYRDEPPAAQPATPPVQAQPDVAEALHRFRTALQSIANNTCCDRCQEAAAVARAALQGVQEK